MQWKWFLGFSIMIATAFLSVVCAAFISILLYSTTVATAIASAVILSCCWLKEKFYPKFDIPALSLVVGGCLGILLLANRTAEDYTFEELVDLVKSRKSAIYLCFIGLLFLISVFVFLGLMYFLEQFEKSLEIYASE